MIYVAININTWPTLTPVCFPFVSDMLKRFQEGCHIKYDIYSNSWDQLRFLSCDSSLFVWVNNYTNWHEPFP